MRRSCGVDIFPTAAVPPEVALIVAYVLFVVPYVGSGLSEPWALEWLTVSCLSLCYPSAVESLERTACRTSVYRHLSRIHTEQQSYHEE